jgi:hypothetical protein
MNIFLIVLISGLLIGNIIFLIHYAGLYPFYQEARRPREAFFSLPSRFPTEKINTHEYQVLSGWNDLVRKWSREKIYDLKDPTATLQKVMNQYQEDPSPENFDIMVQLSNHISNRVRYDEKIDALIEKISGNSIGKSKKE